MRLIREMLDNGGMGEEEREALLETLFAIFYVDDGHIASQDHVFLQQAMDTLVATFKRVGLETNTTRTRRTANQSDKARHDVALVPSSWPMDLAQALRVQNPTRYRSGSRGDTQRGAKEELLTDRASMVEHLLDTYHHHGWEYHPEFFFWLPLINWPTFTTKSHETPIGEGLDLLTYRDATTKAE
jgi:hypothetical protein